MRSITVFERELINQIMVYHNNGIVPNLASIIDPLLVNKDIYLDFNASTAELRIDNSMQSNIIYEVVDLTRIIATAVHLLKDLQSNGYITLYLETNLPGNFRFGQLFQGHQYVASQIHDPTVVRLLLEYSLTSIIVGQPLINFIANNFRTEEQVRADVERTQTLNDSRINTRNLYIAAGALVISTIFSGIEIYLAIQEVRYGKMQVEQQQNVKLDSSQQSLFLNQIHNTRLELEYLESYLKTSDSTLQNDIKEIKASQEYIKSK